MHSLLLGNGVNRVASQKEWTQLLRELAHEFRAEDLISQIAEKPLSMFIEELCAREPGSFERAERAVKSTFARLLTEIDPSDVHRRICDPFKVIMTTNYDFTIEAAFGKSRPNPAHLALETRYNLFRRYQVAGREIWHVHGDIRRPSSMVLGYDHYAGNLQKIRNYATGGVEIKKLGHRIATLLRGENLEIERSRSVYSWVDYFLRDHIHIVGLGMDFTEIDLWWLLLHKRRRRDQTGRVFFYQISAPRPPEETAVTSLLRSLSVEVVRVTAQTYEDCYLRVADAIQKRMQDFPHLLPMQPRSKKSATYPQR